MVATSVSKSRRSPMRKDGDGRHDSMSGTTSGNGVTRISNSERESVFGPWVNLVTYSSGSNRVATRIRFVFGLARMCLDIATLFLKDFRNHSGLMAPSILLMHPILLTKSENSRV